MAEKYEQIAFQGAPGAYSDLACRTLFPNLQTLPCNSFEDAFLAVNNREADLAMIPVDNTIAGRVADVHHLIPEGGLYITGEFFLPIQHCLLGLKGAKKEGLKHVHSHIHALPQCRKFISRLGLKGHVHADTAGAAEEVSRKNDPEHCAIASSLAAEIYGLEIFEKDIQDAQHNTTRFLILAPEPEIPPLKKDEAYITSLTFAVRHIPAALYKSLGGFATNGISLAKLESYVDENFQAAQFYCDLEAHPESAAYKRAFEELQFYARNVKFLGAYKSHPLRKTYRRDPAEI
jgi:prephenate dehydratase